LRGKPGCQVKENKKGNKGDIVVTNDSGATLWSAVQSHVKGMDLGPLEQAVGGGGGARDQSREGGEGSGGGGGGGGAAAREAAKEARAKKKRETERAKLAALKASASAPPPSAIKELERDLLPLVKRADELQTSGGELAAALALYEDAMDGFQTKGFRRPKLQAKIEALRHRIATAAAAAAATTTSARVDESVEVDASTEVVEQ
jgi:hypothetical protein